MTRTLEPGDLLSRYRIVGPLGAGGMGEVYRARDQSLERDVALKVLPPRLVKSEERLRRFVLEAKSASSLNHPNIVTIYEIGQETASSEGVERETMPGPLHFISMELVTGETLSHKIHDEKCDLKTLLGWLAQAADGISKAHAAGIVHRDLKPGNIMISSDGYAKVLDFGLAKLTEKNATDVLETSAPTEVQDRTAEGVIMGTAGYMSPEQVVGKSVDHRTDIFAFGCILYEAATRRRPFAAETGVETMHKILNENPAPVEELNPKTPAELRRLIRRCLSKNPEQRFQSMKDLAIELREIVEEYDQLSASATSATGGSGSMAALPERKHFPLVPVLAGAGLVTLVALAIGIWGLRRGGGTAETVAPNLKMDVVTNSGDVSNPVLSPDGRYLAYLTGQLGLERLRVRQIATGSDIEILPSQTIQPFGFVFSPDGNYFYYLSPDPEHSGYKGLYQVPSLGGTPKKMAYDIDSPVTFSPDGREVAFIRGMPAEKKVVLLIRNLESGQERVLATAKEPASFVTVAPAWSPDGKLVAVPEANISGNGGARLALFRVSDGQRETFESTSWPRINSFVWTPDAKSLIVAGSPLVGTLRNTVTQVFIRDGKTRPITGGFDSYGSVSLTADGRTLALLRQSTVSNLWMLDLSGGAPAVRQLTFSSNSENSIANPRVAPEGGHLYYQAPSNGRLSVWSVGEDGTNPKPITQGQGIDFELLPAKDGAVFQRIDDTLVPHIWRVDADGGNQKPLTNGGGETLVNVSRDGTSILYFTAEAPRRLLIMPSTGGESRALVEDYDNNASLSPDGRLLGYSTVRAIDGVTEFTTVVIRVADATPVSFRRLSPAATNVTWSADGPSILYSMRNDPAWNIFRQELNDSPPRQLTHFTEGRTAGAQASPDGSKLIIPRQIGQTMNIWLADRDGSNPVQATQFPTGTIFGGEWLRDGSKVVLTYGLQSRDAVLVKGF